MAGTDGGKRTCNLAAVSGMPRSCIYVSRGRERRKRISLQLVPTCQFYPTSTKDQLTWVPAPLIPLVALVELPFTHQHSSSALDKVHRLTPMKLFLSSMICRVSCDHDSRHESNYSRHCRLAPRRYERQTDPTGRLRQR